MKREITPEEKLLVLIKNKNKMADNGDTALVVPSASQPERAATASGKPSFVSKILGINLFKNKLLNPVVSKSTNKYLIIILGALVLYLAAELLLIRPYRNIESIISKESESGEKSSRLPPDTSSEAKDYSSYSQQISGKAIFGQTPVGQIGAQDNINVSDSISDRIALVGIIAGDNPQAIIEDKKNQKTYYLNKGQSFDGYVLEEISDSKVILDYEGKKIALFL